LRGLLGATGAERVGAALCVGATVGGAMYVAAGACESTAFATRGAGLERTCTTGRVTGGALQAVVTSARSSGASGEPPPSSAGMTASSVPADRTAGAANSLALGDLVMRPRAKKHTNSVTTPAACQARGWSKKIGRSCTSAPN